MQGAAQGVGDSKLTPPERTARPKPGLSLVEVNERTPACTRAGVLAAPGPPRGAAELSQLQDHDHQNDDDQDTDDDSDNSSVHFASLDTGADSQLQIRPLNTNLSLTSGPSCGKRVPYVGPIPLRLQL